MAGIVRRAILKIWLLQGSAGSIPVRGTKIKEENLRPEWFEVFFFFIPEFLGTNSAQTKAIGGEVTCEIKND